MKTNKSLQSKRLNKDYSSLVQSSELYVKSLKHRNETSHFVVHDVINLNKNDNSVFLVVINGAEDTLYSNAKIIFKFVIDQAKRNYPFTAPTVTCVTPVYHPNINKQGHICLDILGNNWVAAQTFVSVVTSISSFLDSPNPDDPLFPEAANLYKKNRKDYNAKVKEFVDKYATDAEYLRIKNGGTLDAHKHIVNIVDHGYESDDSQDMY
jgi:ubiquitin-conjugating enzyme E2 D/E